MAKKNRNNLSFVGENIRKIRQAKKLSQADFSQLFNLARASIGAYEEGRSEPKIETLIAIANYFSMSIDALLTRRLTVAEIYKFNRLNEKLDRVHQMKGKGMRKLPSAKLLPTGQYLNYIVQHSSRDYLESLDEVGLPSAFSDVSIVLEMNGGEMTRDNQGIHHGDLLICQQVPADSLGESIGEVVTLMTESEIVTRRLKEFSDHTITLVADDPSYPDKEISSEEVLIGWKIKGVISGHIPKPMQTEERLLRIEEELKRLRG